jgi:hypothetical protein
MVQGMSNSTASSIIESLEPRKVFQNNKGDFWEIRNAYLCLGAKTTEKSKLLDKFEYKGWYRFFNSECVAEKTLMVREVSQLAASDDEARLWVLVNAVSEILVEPMEELAESGALPINLYIISAVPSFIKTIAEILVQPADDYEFGRWELYANVKWYLRLMRSVYLCSVSEDLVRFIRKWPSQAVMWT